MAYLLQPPARADDAYQAQAGRGRHFWFLARSMPARSTIEKEPDMNASPNIPNRSGGAAVGTPAPGTASGTPLRGTHREPRP